MTREAIQQAMEAVVRLMVLVDSKEKAQLLVDCYVQLWKSLQERSSNDD